MLEPLSIPAQSYARDCALALARLRATPRRAQQQAWTTAFGEALGSVRFRNGTLVGRFPRGGTGPVPVMMADLLAMARSGALDGALISTDRFYQTNFTKALLFLSDGTYLEQPRRRRRTCSAASGG